MARNVQEKLKIFREMWNLWLNQTYLWPIRGPITFFDCDGNGVLKPNLAVEQTFYFDTTRSIREITRFNFVFRSLSRDTQIIIFILFR